jgi:hypothetical protein
MAGPVDLVMLLPVRTGHQESHSDRSMKLNRLRFTVRLMMVVVAIVALAFWGLYAQRYRDAERRLVLTYKMKATHNRDMVRVALKYVPELEQSISCKLGDGRRDPYPALSVEQCKRQIPHYYALAEYYRQLADAYFGCRTSRE